MGMTLVWCCRPAPAVCKPGFTSAPRRFNRRWRPPPARCWPWPMEAIQLVPLGVTWEDSPASPIRSLRGARAPATPLGSRSWKPGRVWRHTPRRCCRSAREWASLGPSGATDTNSALSDSVPAAMAASVAREIHQGCMERWHIRDRFPHPDWSIVDLWIARRLLSRRWTPAQVHDILRLASPQFPRRHGNPDDYLRRTIARAAFPHPRRPVCAVHARASSRLEDASTCSNSTGGRYPNAECSRFWL